MLHKVRWHALWIQQRQRESLAIKRSLSTHPPRRLVLRIPVILLGGLVHLEGGLAILCYLHDACSVPAAIAIIRRRPDGDELAVEHVFVALLYQLMGARYESEIVDMVELRIPVASGQARPTTNILHTSAVTFPPKSQPAPRGLTDQVSISSGSDHIKSAMKRVRVRLPRRLGPAYRRKPPRVAPLERER